MNDPLIWQLILQLIFILISALFAAAESALLALNPAKLKSDAEDGDHRAEKLIALTETPAPFLAAVRTGTTLAGLLGSAFAALHFSGRLARWLEQFVDWNGAMLRTLTAVAVALVLAYFTLLLGQQLPRCIAAQRPMQAARLTAPAVHAVSVVLRPVIWLQSVTVSGLLKLFGLNSASETDNVTEEDIRMMLDVGEEEGCIESTEGEMIDNIFEFNNIQIYDVMTHRVDVEVIDVEDSRADIIDTIRCTGFSRFPVYEGEMDHIIGLLYVKDFFLNEGTPLRELLKEPMYVPDSMICDDLFHKMQRENTHFAIVTDEYGSFLGVITLEDLLEEIVGNIYDEYDKKKEYISPNADGSWNISGRTDLKDIEKALNIELPEHEDFNTLGGLVLSVTAQIPKDGAQFTVEADGLRIQVLRVADRRIEETKVTVL